MTVEVFLLIWMFIVFVFPMVGIILIDVFWPPQPGSEDY